MDALVQADALGEEANGILPQETVKDGDLADLKRRKFDIGNDGL
jgi:hypothetical protein